MTNIRECKTAMKRYITARIPFLSLNTIERARTLDMLSEISEEMGITMYVHDISKGTYNIRDNSIVSEDREPYLAIDFISEQMKKRDNITMVFTEMPDLATENSDSRRMLALVTLAEERGGCIIILTNGPVWAQLQRAGMTLQIDLPDEEEMYDIIKEYIDAYRSQIPIEWGDEDIKEAASILVGASRIEAQNVVASLIANREVKKSDMDEVRLSKDRLFSDISGLERIEVSDHFAEVGGLEGLRKWLDEKRNLLTTDNRALLREKGLQPPRGILLVGVPGCGKSLSAKSISANWKMPLYRLDFATVQGEYVGQSERQLKEALNTAEDMSPCILWIDEIEKGLAGSGGGDGGVSTKMVGQFLFWLQECKKQVFVVATANDVSQLPQELLRRGRFDELFFVDLPSEGERRDILSLYFRKYLMLDFAGPFSDEIVQITDGFTGADLESAVREITYRQIANPEFVLTDTAIKSVFENVVPLSKTSPETIEKIRDWGRERAVPASGKPIGGSISRSNEVHTRKVLL